LSVCPPVAEYLRCASLFVRHKALSCFPAYAPLPASLTLCLSYKCNSRCKTCFIWQHPPGEELSLGEWEKVLKSLGRAPSWITISGGEPFLCDSLVAFVKLVCDYNRPLVINIPTNCLLPEQIKQKTHDMLNCCFRTRLIVNMSLDNVGVEHDIIRGVEGNFVKFQECYRLLSGLKKSYPHLIIGVNTIISKFNINDLPRIISFVDDIAPDSFVAEIADEREELHNVGEGLRPGGAASFEAVGLLRDYSRKKSAQSLAGLIRNMRYRYYTFVKYSLLNGREVFSCRAGTVSAYIDASGTIWPCCRMKRLPLGSLRDYDYDFRKAWRSGSAVSARRAVRQTRCRCLTANNFYTNFVMAPFRSLIRYF